MDEKISNYVDRVGERGVGTHTKGGYTMNARTRIMLSINQLEDDLITLRQRIKQLCPMCGDAPAKNDSICEDCTEYVNAPHM